MTEIARAGSLRLEVMGVQTINVRATTLVLNVMVSQTGNARANFLQGAALAEISGPVRAGFLGMEVLVKIGNPVPYVPPRNILPWTIAPDWQTGVTERLKWKTDVLASQNGTEQRRRLRTSPRREIEATYRTYARDRRFLDACLTGPGATLWQVPLWWDRYVLLAPVEAGATSLALDTLFGELLVGDTVMILGSNPFAYELAEVSGIDVPGKTVRLMSIIQNSWGATVSVYNTRVCRLQEKQSSTRKGSNASDTMLTFETTGVNDAPAYDPPYSNPPPGLQLEFRPNFANDLTTEYAHLYASFDNETGKAMRRDLGLRAFHVMQFEYIAVNRFDHNRFRGFLYYMQGKLRSILIPTYSADMDLVPYTSIAADATLIQVIAAGYTTYVGADEPDRNSIIFFFHDGTVLVSFITAAVYTGPDGHGHNIEAIRLAAPVGRAIKYADVDKICFMQHMRQDQDDFEIKHETDSTGTTKFSTTFRSVGPGRGAAPYQLQFTGSFVKNDAPPQLPIDVSKYQQPAGGVLGIPFYPEERWTPEVGGDGTGNSDGGGDEGSEL